MTPVNSEDCIYSHADGQSGFFTRKQAIDCGIGDNLLAYHVEVRRYDKTYTGVYRLRNYPGGPHDHVMGAWLAVGHESAVVSHETALRIHDLSDVIPYGVHLTVPRGKRVRKDLPGVRVHTTTREFKPRDIVFREGMKVTSVARTIADCAQLGTGPEQIEMAVAQAIAEGLTTPKRLREATADRSRRVQSIVDCSIELASA
jgi:predicted transcriptional regulator of viral defense system